MAIVEGTLTEAMILGLKGTIDFYYHRGQLVARMWPKKRTIPPTVAEAASQSFFGLVQTKIKNMSAPNRDQWRQYVVGRNIVWTDAIRFFNLSDNPTHKLWQSCYYSHTIASKNGNVTTARSYFKPDIGFEATDPELMWGVNAQKAPLSPVKWQEVKIKARRRAILDKQIRPALSTPPGGSIVNWDIGKLFYHGKISSTREGFFHEGVMLPKFMLNSKKHQSPIFQFNVPDMLDGDAVDIYPTNIKVPVVPFGDIPADHWPVWP